MNYALIRVRLRKLSEQIQITMSSIEKLSGYIENLDIFWDGDANCAYKIRVYADIEMMISVLSEFIDLLKLCDSALFSYQETEKVVQQLIGGFKYEGQKKGRNRN